MRAAGLLSALTLSCLTSMTPVSVVFQVKHYMVVLSWVFDKHVKENRNYTVTDTLTGTVNVLRITLLQIVTQPRFTG